MEAGQVEGDEDVPSVPLPELPTEMLWFQILTRLPAKSLMRFKCVCKSWSSLITGNPSFLRVYQNLHCNLNKSHLLLKVQDKVRRQQHFLSLQINQHGIPSSATATHLLTLQTQEFRLHNTQCINGLVCFVFGNDHAIRIFNPCTRESIILPSYPPSNNHSADTEYFFGFSPLTNKYMFLQVQLCKFLYEGPANFFRMVSSINLQIFTLGTDSWRCVEVDHDDLPFDPTVWVIDKKSVCLHGAIHWVHGEGQCILAFDLGEERFRVIPFPENDGSRHVYQTIADVGGCLALPTYDKNTVPNLYVLRLWILKDYQNKVWVKEIIFLPYPVLLSAQPFSSLCACHRGKVLIRSSPSAQASLHLYNRESESFQTRSIILPEWIRQNDACNRCDILSSYDETIVSLK